MARRQSRNTIGSIRSHEAVPFRPDCDPIITSPISRFPRTPIVNTTSRTSLSSSHPRSISPSPSPPGSIVKVIDTSTSGFSPMVKDRLYIRAGSWNARGLWLRDPKKRAEKLKVVKGLMSKLQVLVLQETHVSRTKLAAFQRFTDRNDYTFFRTRTRRGRLGGIILVQNSFARRYHIAHDTIIP